MFFIALISFLFHSSPVLAFDAGGKLTHSYFYSTENVSDRVLTSRSSAELRLSQDVNKDSKVVILPQVDWIYESTLVSENKAKQAIWNLKEGYGQIDQGNLRILGGKKIYSWGSSDTINPTDYFGAKDQTRFAGEEEDKRKGVTGLSASWTQPLGKYSFSFQAVAAFAGIESNPLLIAGEPVLGVENLGRKSGSESGFGIQSSLAADLWDFGFSVYYGQNHEPELQYLGVGAHGLQVALVHQRMKAIGVDGSFTFEKWIFRTEAAYKLFELIHGTDQLLQPDRGEIVVGVERPIGEQFRLHIQYFARKHYPSDLIAGVQGANPAETLLLQGLKRSNQILGGFDGDFEQGVTIRGTLSLLDERLQVQAIAIALFESQGSLLRPSVQWTGFDSWVLTAGMAQYSGPELTAFGQLRPLSSGFAEVRYVF